jgi:hypothetical protein
LLKISLTRANRLALSLNLPQIWMFVKVLKTDLTSGEKLTIIISYLTKINMDEQTIDRMLARIINMDEKLDSFATREEMMHRFDLILNNLFKKLQPA